MMKKLFLILVLLAIPAFSASAEIDPLRILIVPGHDKEKWGAEFRGVKEANMNVKLALLLQDLLKKDPNFNVYLTRDWDGYTKEFREYFDGNMAEIELFRTGLVENMKRAVEESQFKILADNPPHSKTDPETALRLYGINKWANENNIDLITHIHFNDYPRKPQTARGKYSGFAIYFPEAELKNSPQSFYLGSFVFQKLFRNWPVSTYPHESPGLVPEQKLIAVGANNSLDQAAAILIEYGYIYEKRFSTFAKRDAELRKMAKATHEGIKNYAAFTIK